MMKAKMKGEDKFKVECLDEMFGLIFQKMDPQSCQNRDLLKKEEALLDHREKLYRESMES